MINIPKFFTMLLLAYSPLLSEHIYQVSVCATFQNEARFLSEWIDYHVLLGVEHFYLYNNSSDDEFEAVLNPYIEAGIVELVDWPFPNQNREVWRSSQKLAYLDCIHERSLGTTKWLAIIDIDEFLVPTDSHDLAAFLEPFEPFGGLCINWQMYGTSNVQHLETHERIIEKMVWKAPVTHEKNYTIKSIVQPERVRGTRSCHTFLYHPPYYHVDEKGQQLHNRETYKAPQVSIDHIRINHYWCKDEDFFTEMKIPRRKKLGYSEKETMDLKNALNEVYDPIAFTLYETLTKEST